MVYMWLLAAWVMLPGSISLQLYFPKIRGPQFWETPIFLAKQLPSLSGEVIGVADLTGHPQNPKPSTLACFLPHLQRTES